ncbi:MAG: hypothetical protein AAF611_13935 [Bacteroidota bacterium]
MKKKHINLKQLSLRKSRVASLESNGVTGGFQSWTGTAEPCFLTELGCNITDGCPQTVPNCPPIPTRITCPKPTDVTCGFTQGPCQSDSICPQGIQCY